MFSFRALMIAGIFVCGLPIGHAQNIKELPTENLTAEQAVSQRVRNSRDKNYISVSVENDLFAGRDRDSNYTSGIRMTYFNVGTPVPEILDKVASTIPTFDLNDTTSTYVTLGQNIYTPEDITARANQDDDRPWAGFLYGSAGLVTLKDNHVDELELTLGVVGPEALAEQTQKFIHKHLSNSDLPKGWNNQLDTEPALNVSAKRRWPRWRAAEFAGFRFDAEPNINMALGNVYTHAGGGMSFTLQPDFETIADKPPRVPPGMPGTGYFETPKRGWDWQLFGGVSARLVGRTIFLDGNTFSDSHSVDKKYLVGDATLGAAVTQGPYRLSYSYNIRSKEFNGQDDDITAFGSLNLSTRF